MSRNVALSTGVDAGTVTPTGTSLVDAAVADDAGVAVGSVTREVDGVQGSGAGRRRHLGDDLVAVADVDVLLAGHLVHRVAAGVVRDRHVHQVVAGAESGSKSRRRTTGRAGSVASSVPVKQPSPNP